MCWSYCNWAAIGSDVVMTVRPCFSAQPLGQFQRRGARIEHDRFAVLDLCGGGGGDGLLGGLILPEPLEELELEADPLGHGRPAVRADHLALLGQRLKVAADGHAADAEPLDQFLDRTFAPLGDQLADLILPATSGSLTHLADDDTLC